MSALAAPRLGAPVWLATAGLCALCLITGVLAGLEPELAIAGVLGLAFVVVAIANLTAGVVIFTVALFLETLLTSDALLSFTKLAGGFLALSWLARMLTQRDVRSGNLFSAHPVATFLLAAFLAWAAASLLWAESVPSGLTDLLRYLLQIGLYVIVFAAVQTRRDAGWVLGALLAGTAVTAAYGLVVQPSVDSVDRLASSVGNPNQLAAILVVGATLSVGVALAMRKSAHLALAAVAVAVLSMIAFVPTGSRSGVVALGVVLVAVVVMAGRWRAKATVMALALASITVLVFAALAPPEIRDRIATTTPTEASSSEEGRATIWQVAQRVVEDNPAIGVAVGNYQTRAIDYVLEPGLAGRTDQVIDEPENPHNTYLHVLAELGLVGVIPFLAILIFSLSCGYLAARGFERAGDERMEIVARAQVVALAGLLTANFFASEQFNSLMWLLLALGPALLAIASRSSPNEDGSTEALLNRAIRPPQHDPVDAPGPRPIAPSNR